MIRTLVVLLAVGTSTARAQAQSLVGAWQLNYPAGMRMMDGEATMTMATGSLTLQAKGDSVVGDLVTDPSSGAPARPPVHLVGKVRSGEAVLVSRGKATLNMNGAQEEVVSVSTWTLHVKGDSLSGTVDRKLEGHDMGNQGAQSLTGTRKKN